MYFKHLLNDPKRKTSTTTSGEEELNTSSVMNIFTDSKVSEYILSNESDSFETCATEYKLKGKLGELCEHNASIAAKVGKPTVNIFLSIHCYLLCFNSK